MSQPLLAISPIDGRYAAQLESLSAYFSEFALIRYRVLVETEYFIALSEAGFFPLSAAGKKALRKAVQNLSAEEAQRVKDIEKVTNHDVKAVEYFLKEKLADLRLGKHKEWVHFGLTSQDVNNTAVPLLWKDALQLDLMPRLQTLNTQLKEMAKAWDKIPMLARTHGQPASPTRLGKEIRELQDKALREQIPFFVAESEALTDVVQTVAKVAVSPDTPGVGAAFTLEARLVRDVPYVVEGRRGYEATGTLWSPRET